MDVNEHERLYNITLSSTHIQVKEQHLYCCSVFHIHSRVFRNDDFI
jgi:hypothetical protein